MLKIQMIFKWIRLISLLTSSLERQILAILDEQDDLDLSFNIAARAGETKCMEAGTIIPKTGHKYYKAVWMRVFKDLDYHTDAQCILLNYFQYM